jgi:capsular polysaccharide biosynthesis protein
MKFLLKPPFQEDFSTLLGAWRAWILSVLLGALIGAGVYAVFPPPYRAEATVVVDFNLEEAWPENTDRDMFYYLERETRKLMELAWSDPVLETVAAQVGGITVGELRNEKLNLSQPREAGWHLWADDTDPERAQQLASAWALAFADRVRDAVSVELELQALRAASQSGQTCVPDLQARIANLEAHAAGINAYIEVNPSQITGLPITRRTGLGTYVLAGAFACFTLMVFLVLFVNRKQGSR